MDPTQTSEPPVFDRRQIYRPFLERINPIASLRSVVQQDLIVPPAADPRDSDQPPIHEALASAAELQPGVQMALVGGIGSGKTTELHLTMERLKRYPDAVNVYIEAAEFTDFSQTNPGAILASVGLRLFARYRKLLGEPSEAIMAAHQKLRELGQGKVEWHDDDPRDFGDDYGFRVDLPGLMKPRLAQLKEDVLKVADLLGTIVLPFLEHGKQLTVIVDGLDRLIDPVRFREFAEQDLRAVRGIKVSMILAAPLLLWYDKTRFLQDYFDLVKHIPAASVDPKESVFLRDILKRRGAGDLMSTASVNEICQFSGGVLRDLLWLAQSAAQYAYRDAEDRIARKHVQAAIRQLGNRYLAGLGPSHQLLIRRLQSGQEFNIDYPRSRELLVNRQVLEYSKRGRDYFKVHPALVKVLPQPQ
jgi:hypothetical protein